MALGQNKMRKVVDTNYLQSDELIEYLSVPKNMVVVPDQVSLEAYKGNIFESMQILSRYPRQVIILKRTQAITRLSPKNKGLQKRLIDARQTKGFPKYCVQLENAKNGDTTLIQSIENNKKKASDYVERATVEAGELAGIISEMFCNTTKSERKTLRNGPPFIGKFREKAIRDILEITKKLFEGHIGIDVLPSSKNISNYYLFRYAVSCYFVSLKWHTGGGLSTVKAKTMRNDFIDMQIATYATFFDGLLSNDTKAVNAYRILREFIGEIMA